MIERHWDALAKIEMAERYVQHLLQETFPALAKIAGFERATILRRNEEDGVHFRIITTWKNQDAIRTFAGDDPERAVVPEQVAKMMIRFEARACHFCHST
jgi:heme-degrading monooxygenase HmoA